MYSVALHAPAKLVLPPYRSTPSQSSECRRSHACVLGVTFRSVECRLSELRCGALRAPEPKARIGRLNGADLPRTGLLVCNLNAHYKIDVPIWRTWTNIIRRSADAVRAACGTRRLRQCNVTDCAGAVAARRRAADRAASATRMGAGRAFPCLPVLLRSVRAATCRDHAAAGALGCVPTPATSYQYIGRYLSTPQNP